MLPCRQHHRRPIDQTPSPGHARHTPSTTLSSPPAHIYPATNRTVKYTVFHLSWQETGEHLLNYRKYAPLPLRGTMCRRFPCSSHLPGSTDEGGFELGQPLGDKAYVLDSLTIFVTCKIIGLLVKYVSNIVSTRQVREGHGSD